MPDLDSTIAAAFEQHSGASATPTADVAPTPSDSAPTEQGAVEPSEGARTRDDKGRFTASTEKPAAAEKKPDAPAVTATGAQAQAPIPAPANWKGSGKVEWSRLPRAVQQHIADDFAARGKTDEELNGFRSVITPERAQAFAAQYGGTPQAIKQLLAISDYATKDAAGFLRWFAQQNRIDLTSITGQPAATGEQTPPQGQHPLEREVGELRSALQQMRQDAHQRQLDAVMAEVNAFKADSEHPYYNDVEQHIIALLPTIQGTTRERLQKAYDQAVWANPQVREALLASERDKALKQNAANVADARKAAGLNGSPAGAKVAGASEPKRSLEDTVRHAANQILQ